MTIRSYFSESVVERSDILLAYRDSTIIIVFPVFEEVGAGSHSDLDRALGCRDTGRIFVQANNMSLWEFLGIID